MNNRFTPSKVMLAVLVGLIVSTGPNWVFAEEPKKEAAGDVQERAVPRLWGVGGMTPKTGRTDRARQSTQGHTRIRIEKGAEQSSNSKAIGC